MNLLDILLVFCVRYLIFLLPLPALYFWFKKQRTVLWKVLLSSMMALAVSEILKYIIRSPRPIEPLNLLGGAEGASFPSSHSAAAAAIACSYWLHSHTFGVVVFLLALLVGVGRVLGGVHYPIDIGAGLAIGVIVAVIADHLVIYYKK